MSFDMIVPLFVPGHRSDRFEKAAASGADAIILDLEDAVPRDIKDKARAAICTAFTTLPVLVRVNGIGTPWFSEDIEAVSKIGVAGIVVPKAELSETFDALARNSAAPIFALIETACGVAQAREILRLPRVERLFFGSIDYCADLGCEPTQGALLSARSELVLASRLCGLTGPVDGVTAAIHDGEQLAEDTRHAKNLGFCGKLAIHPNQIAGIRSGFMPTEAEVLWARKALSSLDGAVSIDGMMVDEPVRLRAKAVLARLRD